MRIEPEITVLMPFYNARPYLNEAIESILKQSFFNFELILIDDASIDGSDLIVKKYLDDPRIVSTRNIQRKGIVENLNYGLDHAKCELVARMDGDDIADPNRLAIQRESMLSRPELALLGSDVEIVDEKGASLGVKHKPVGTRIKEVCFYEGPFAHPAIMYRKSCVVAVGGYRKKYELCEDIDLYFRLIFTGHSLDNLSIPLLKYRQHGNSTANQSRKTGIKSFLLKREMIKTYGLKLNHLEFSSMYIHLALDWLLPGQRKRRLEGLLKKTFQAIS